MESKTDLRSSAATSHASKLPSETPADITLGQIREILFGAHLKSINERFSRVEDMLLSHNTRLLNLLNKRVEVLQEMFESRNALLEESITKEKMERIQALQTLDSALREQGRQLQRDFEALSNATDEKMARLQATVRQEADDLRQGLGDHETDLAELFREMADKLLNASKR